jgi:hypothetical protein
MPTRHRIALVDAVRGAPSRNRERWIVGIAVVGGGSALVRRLRRRRARGGGA